MEKLKAFADKVNFQLELDPAVVKESLEKGQPDPNKPAGNFKIRPIFINADAKYSPISPYDFCEL